MTRSIIWLTCSDLWHAGVSGTGNHNPGYLGDVFECYCTENARRRFDECQDPVRRRIHGSRIGLRLCCSCQSFLERHVAREFGWRGSEPFFYAKPAAERVSCERIVLGRICRRLLYDRGRVGTWNPDVGEQRKLCRARIEAEREGVAA